MGVVVQDRMALVAHPNELDRRRIERALRSRKRYRYVTPRVAPATGGYRVESPCCSRNVDRDGGVIDVALLLHDAASGQWRLFSKDHAGDAWRLHSTHERIAAALDLLGEDAGREFWQ